MREPKQSSAERRRLQEAKRQSDKDRAEHEGARGKKMPSLKDLSREMPSEADLINFLDMVAQEPSDRSAAIMSAGLVEQALFVAVTSRLADPGPTVHNSWFEDVNAPFGTFSAKIKLGRALAIYGPRMDETLCRIKDIRNVFAHRSTPIDFTNSRIIEEVKKLNEKPMIGERPARTRYSAACLSIARHLIEDGLENGGKEIPVKFP